MISKEEEEKREGVSLVGKLLKSSKYLHNLEGWGLKRGEYTNQIFVGDIVMITEELEYDCYCMHKNTNMYACIEIAWLPRIALRFLTKREEVCGVDIPIGLLSLLFPEVDEIAPEMDLRSKEEMKSASSGKFRDSWDHTFYEKNWDWESLVER